MLRLPTGALEAADEVPFGGAAEGGLGEGLLDAVFAEDRDPGAQGGVDGLGRERLRDGHEAHVAGVAPGAGGGCGDAIEDVVEALLEREGVISFHDAGLSQETPPPRNPKRSAGFLPIGQVADLGGRREGEARVHHAGREGRELEVVHSDLADFVLER